MEIRSFLAFELPDKIKEIVGRISEDVRRLQLDIRCVKPDNIHLTVVFMGSISGDDVGPIGNEAESICKRYGPFKISLNGCGIFGGRRNPRVLWIGLDGDIQRMADLRDSLQHSLVPIGIKQETRPFKPHLTLARFREGFRPSDRLDEFLTKYHALSSPLCQLNELIMFKSELNPGGPVYTKLNAWPLSGGRNDKRVILE